MNDKYETMDLDAKIYVAGHQGMVGSAILRKLKKAGYYNFVLRTSVELDLREQDAVQRFFEIEEPEYIFLAAARVGGIHANNTYRAEFIYDNLAIQNNVIHQSFKSGVRKLLFLGSSCIYPKYAQQPMKEEALLTGSLEPTNEPYAIAKIAGIKLCQAYHAQYGSNFISLMPTNLYGPNDNYDLENAHVLPALIRKIHEAKTKDERDVEIWGTGTVRREFLHVDDLADACLFLMNNYSKPGIINVGTGKDLSIYELALLLKSVIGYKGRLRFNPAKPDGTPRKLLDTTRINHMGWYPKIELWEGIQKVYAEYEKRHLQTH
ncbi:GDP-L-fucose synthetase [Fulvivirga imtechensis AK7]|uniref:GDP-L-fucose synthase n=2 Tax=Fulvivirga TaxID=396811 RepID=L8JTQ6_9BACT|nr:GDP-L-fucose synthetase [Fulvivirga imtechensis AK7]